MSSPTSLHTHARRIYTYTLAGALGPGVRMPRRARAPALSPFPRGVQILTRTWESERRTTRKAANVSRTLSLNESRVGIELALLLTRVLFLLSTLFLPFLFLLSPSACVSQSNLGYLPGLTSFSVFHPLFLLFVGPWALEQNLEKVPSLWARE
ncbi:uncharacterized protein BDZ83DRAFT_307304 [Colletotrichum acutatum]|uniref:Uncharacterized protein n=1 Tax=Glomerella acutata TaxID=27357 RepID=A0AAD8UQA9_GLOAC|nr:uncharacterized protein BDZ83DRAFT_307304 [Colletotrichum acutatum]KAK1725411.1 hypothetical protein BDZ83DRAFT_307304 [Colletotrichum acutatum]